MYDDSDDYYYAQTHPGSRIKLTRCYKYGDLPETLIISGEVDQFDLYDFWEPQTIEVVRFEPGTVIRELSCEAFGAFSSLKSLIIPSSVEVIDRCCFCLSEHVSCSSLATITFAPGSKLLELQRCAFSGCTALKSLSLPATVQRLHGEAFAECAIAAVEIDPGNEYFCVRGPFVVGIQPPISLVCYFGRLAAVAIDDDIEILGSSLFTPSAFLERVTFGGASRLTTIQKGAFRGCEKLESIAIPAAVTSIARNAFARCTRLSDVTFVAPTSLTAIHMRVFRHCVNLRAIVIPSSLVVLHVNCFNRCTGLADVSFESPSHLVRIEFRAFAGCTGLASLCIPSSVRYLEEACFADCSALNNLTFAQPSHLVELRSFPPRMSRPFDVPDSVEICSIEDLVPSPGSYLVRFGRESRLREPRSAKPGRARCSPVFLLVPPLALKRVRSTLECGPAPDEESDTPSDELTSSDDSETLCWI
jgi:hypothetical protein